LSPDEGNNYKMLKKKSKMDNVQNISQKVSYNSSLKEKIVTVTEDYAVLNFFINKIGKVYSDGVYIFCSTYFAMFHTSLALAFM
jgi:hypothetical protein